MILVGVITFMLSSGNYDISVLRENWILENVTIKKSQTVSAIMQVSDIGHPVLLGIHFQSSGFKLREIVKDPNGATVSNESISKQLNSTTFPVRMVGTYNITLSNLVPLSKASAPQTSIDLFANFRLIGSASNGPIFSVLSRLMPYAILVNVGVLAVIVGIMWKKSPFRQPIPLTTVPTSHTVTYTPNKGVAGEDKFSYNAIDDQGLASDSATVNIIFNSQPAPSNSTPDNKTIRTNKDTPVQIILTRPIPGNVKFSVTSYPQKGVLKSSSLSKVQCKECRREADIDLESLKKIDFTQPKSRENIIDYAKKPENNVDNVLLAFLARIEDKSYDTVDEVIKAIKDSQVNPDSGMAWKGFASAVIGLVIMGLILFVYKPIIPVISTVPNYVLYLSIVGVLIYFGIIASDKTGKADYRPGTFIPEFTLRITEAPVFMAGLYLLITAGNVTPVSNPGALAALAIFVGLFTRTLEEFYKSIGTMLLKPIEKYVKNKTSTTDAKGTT